MNSAHAPWPLVFGCNDADGITGAWPGGIGGGTLKANGTIGAPKAGGGGWPIIIAWYAVGLKAPWFGIIFKQNQWKIELDFNYLSSCSSIYWYKHMIM